MKDTKPSDLKGYIDHLREITKTRQIKWVRRANSGSHIYDCQINAENALSVYYDVMASRVSLTVVHGENTTIIQNLDIHGETYKALSKLWDIIATLSMAGVIKSWVEVLPEVDKKIKFGPKDIVA